jgi:endonuclease G, mitochondrial
VSPAARRSTLALVLLVMHFAAATPRVMADHLVVSRHALVKESAKADAQTIIEVERGQKLQLASTSQRDGYYEVSLTGGGHGWIYRTLVRRKPGDLPGSAAPAPTSAGSASSAGSSPFAFECLPVGTATEFPVKVLHKQFFVLGYSEERMNPLWVCYAIGPATSKKVIPRIRFATDTATAAKVTHDDYTGSGFSRGHMAPKFALQSRFGKAGSDASFIMSNVCPQFQSHNDGQWGDLEELIAGNNAGGSLRAGWADVYEQVWVIVGPIFDDERAPLDSGVEVPNAFYCIVVDDVAGSPRTLAFVLDHEDERDADLVQALESIDTIEARTGLDFFSTLPDSTENTLEGAPATALWPLAPGG